MIFAAILAGGKGTRMGAQDKPKQYLPLKGKPVIAHTIDAFCNVPDFQSIMVVCPEAWIDETRQIIQEYCAADDRIRIVVGGATRNETIMNSVAALESEFGEDPQHILVTHDSVRPFITERIIRDNITAMEHYDACDTVIPATDTIVVSNSGVEIADIPNRSYYYQGQTPQTFRVGKLKDLYQSLTEQERDILTDACKICVLRNVPVGLVEGAPSNIKITYASDLRMAEAL